jgi:hypothetical protein
MSYNKPLASVSQFGVVKVGSGIAVSNGVISTTGTFVAGDVGYFYSSVTQPNSLPINIVTMNGTTLSQGVTLQSGSRLTVSKTGNYTLQSTIQFTKSTPAGPASTGFFWLRKNGLDVLDSAADVITTSAGAGVIVAINFTLPLISGDYLQIAWNADRANSELVALPAVVIPPARPSAPSVRMTLLQV